MSEETTQEATDTPAAPDTKTKKTGGRRPIFVMVPIDIENVDAQDAEVPPSPEPDDDGKRETVDAVEMPATYHMYAVPAGPGQKAEIRRILKKHNVDLRTIHRVRMFAGEKKFKVETQYNIRF